MTDYFLYLLMAAICVILLGICMFLCGKKFRLRGTDEDQLEIFKERQELNAMRQWKNEEEMFGIQNEQENEVFQKKKEEEKKKEMREQEKPKEKEVTSFFAPIETKEGEGDEVEILPKEATSYLDKSGIFTKFIINETWRRVRLPKHLVVEIEEQALLMPRLSEWPS